MFRSKLHQSYTCAVALALVAITATSHADVLPLAGPADPGSHMAEFELTGSWAQIDFGDGTPGDGDGFYDVNNLSHQWGGDVDVFPNETAFTLGTLTFDTGSLTNIGVETVPVTALDLSGLWAPGSATTDISDVALADWYFNQPHSLSFGPLDAADRVTFSDGNLISVDLSVSADLNVDLTAMFLPNATYSGTFEIAGDAYALMIDDSSPGNRVLVNITGRVSAIPEPGSALLLGTLALAGCRRIRRMGRRDRARRGAEKL